MSQRSQRRGATCDSSFPFQIKMCQIVNEMRLPRYFLARIQGLKISKTWLSALRKTYVGQIYLLWRTQKHNCNNKYIYTNKLPFKYLLVWKVIGDLANNHFNLLCSSFFFFDFCCCWTMTFSSARRQQLLITYYKYFYRFLHILMIK